MSIPIISASVSNAVIAKALDVLADWHNITQRPSYARRMIPAVSVLVQTYGYSPYGGPLFRALNWSAPSVPKVGSVLTASTGLSEVQSWTREEKYAVNHLAHLGNEKDRLIVKLRSPAHELMNSFWLRTVVITIRKQTTDRVLLNSCTNLIECLGGELKNDERETLLVPAKVKVEILRVYPRYREQRYGDTDTKRSTI